MDDALQKLFGSAPRLKLLRLFLFNPTTPFTVSEAASRARIRIQDARREIAMFTTIGLLQAGRGRNKSYTSNSDSPYIGELQALLLSTSGRSEDIFKRLRHVGIIKLVVASGVFLGEWDGRVDLFVVADRIKEDRLRTSIKILESEMGREIRFALLSEQEFMYRLNMNDHLVRDVFDLPHRIILDRLDIGLT